VITSFHQDHKIQYWSTNNSIDVTFIIICILYFGNFVDCDIKYIIKLQYLIKKMNIIRFNVKLYNDYYTYTLE